MPRQIFTTKQQIESVKREISLRGRLYPEWVKQGKMKQSQADYELNCMKAVLETLRAENTLEKDVLKYYEEHGFNQPQLFEENQNAAAA